MLLGQHGGWRKQGHLGAVDNCLERGAQRDFGFSVTHVSAYQPVHGMRLFHVVGNANYRLHLVWSFLEGEAVGQLVHPNGIGSECPAGQDLSSGV